MIDRTSFSCVFDVAHSFLTRFLIQKGGAVAKQVKTGTQTDDVDLFLRIVFELLLFSSEKEGSEKIGSAMHLFVPLARLLELLYELHTEKIKEACTRWANSLSVECVGLCAWMQLSSMLASPHPQLTLLLASDALRSTVLSFFLARGNRLTEQLSGDDDHGARSAGREADAMLGCLRDFAPRLVRSDHALKAPERDALTEMCRKCWQACRWTQIQCSVGAMALAVLEARDEQLELLLVNEQIDLGARLCLCRGICNSRAESLGLIEHHVWPEVRNLFQQADIGSMSTTNRHFLIAALDSLGRCSLTNEAMIAEVVQMVVIHFETTVHGPLDTALKALFKGLSDAKVQESVFALIWDNGRAPMWGPLDHFLRAFGSSCVTQESGFADLLVRASGDIRLKPGAVRVFASFLSVGGSGWEKPLVAAIESKERMLHLSAVQHLIPVVIRSLDLKDAVERLLSAAGESRMIRLALASHLSNQKRVALTDVIPAPSLVKDAIVSYNAWIRRYALETAVAMQDGELVNWYITNMAKEFSQSQRSTASGALCRWWKTKAGGQDNKPVEDILAWNLYPGSPSSRQGTVSAWLATKKTIASAGSSCELQIMLLEMLCSRYDANRAVATDILRREFRGTGVLVQPTERAKLLRLSAKTLKCIRIRIADGGARLFTLLYDQSQLSEAIESALDMLEEHVTVGKTDFSKLSSQYTLHGPLLVLKYLLAEQSSGFTAAETKRLLAGCRAVMELCSSYVCDNTLEGLSGNVEVQYGGRGGGGGEGNQNDDDVVADDEEDDEDGDLSGGSHVRVCAWRGVREACLVIGSAMQRLLPLMEEGDITTTTDSLLEIVLWSKHRGALENASIGLEQTCIACLKDDGSARLLPQSWLERVLNFDAKRMGTVRRSAGIPYAICVILRSECMVCSKRDANTPLVSFTMKKLLDGIDVKGGDSYLVMEGKDLGYYRTQVHHLNILRHVLRDSSLSDLLRPFLEELMLLALKMWNHKEWSIRNSASLLFASAIRKLDPSTGKEVERSVKLKRFEFALFRSHFQALLDHILAVLTSHVDKMQTCGDIFSDLFPILLLIKKLHVATADSFSEKLYACSLRLSAHRNQMIRHEAAKCAAALTPPEEAAQRAAKCIGQALDALTESTTNEAYGLLYCALEMGLARIDESLTLSLSERDLDCIPALCSLRCPPIAAICNEVLRVWNVTLPAAVQAAIVADKSHYKEQDNSMEIPCFQRALESFNKAKELCQERPSAEEGDASTAKPTYPSLERETGFKQLATMLNSEEKSERKHGCLEFQRLFPECGAELLAPAYALSQLFEHVDAPEWFFEILTAPIIECSKTETLVESLTKMTVFEKEENDQFREPVLLMQLAARELERKKNVPKNKDEFVTALEKTIRLLSGPASHASAYDIYFWGPLFEPLFGALCVLNLDDNENANLRSSLEALDLPHLLKKTLQGHMNWLLK